MEVERLVQSVRTLSGAWNLLATEQEQPALSNA